VFDHANTVISRAFTAPQNFLSMVEKNCVSQSQIIIMLGIKERMPDRLPDGFDLHDLQEIVYKRLMYRNLIRLDI